MNQANNLEESIQGLRTTTSDELDRRILYDAAAALTQSTSEPFAATRPRSKTWRTIMKSNWTRAAAASLLLAGGLGMFIILRTASTAYALDQTVEANDRVRTCHVKLTPAGQGVGEAWLEINPDGTPRRLRMDFFKTIGGAKVVVLSEGKAEVWFKDKNSHLLARDKRTFEKMMKMRVLFDPKMAFEQLQAHHKAGRVQVVTEEPAQEGDPIKLTVSSNNVPDRREVYEIDPKTKLVKRIISEKRSDDQWQQAQVRQYLDYNKAIDPAIFQLQLLMPDDVMMIDHMNQDVGLLKGDLTDQQMARKVAREFFEALIAEDYKQAGLICEGIPEQRMKQGFGQIRILRIVEIGEPVPEPRGLRVTVKVEMQNKGESQDKKLIREFRPFIRSLEQQPDRWSISGGL